MEIEGYKYWTLYKEIETNREPLKKGHARYRLRMTNAGWKDGKLFKGFSFTVDELENEIVDDKVTRKLYDDFPEVYEGLEDILLGYESEDERIKQREQREINKRIEAEKEQIRIRQARYDEFSKNYAELEAIDPEPVTVRDMAELIEKSDRQVYRDIKWHPDFYVEGKIIYKILKEL